jgi:alkylation response protein AidB-like acyl-CoA dehydrogenase
VWSGTAACLRRDGGGFILSGTVPRVEAAAQAELFLVTAGESQVLVPASAPGVAVERLPSLDFTRRLGTVTFDDVRVPTEWLVGDEGAAATNVATQARTALVLQCAESVGIAGRVLEFTMEYASERYSFGRSLASYQALKHRFADMRTWLEASAGIVAGAAAAAQADAPDADHLASVAKAYIGDVLPQLVQDCVQMHGGIGVTWEHDIHIYLRRIELNRALYGTPADHRRRLAAGVA